MILKRKNLLFAAGLVCLMAMPIRVEAQSFATISPLYFTQGAGQPAPLPQVIAVASTGSDFNFNTPSVSTESGGNWLQVTPWGPCCRTPEVFTVTASALPAGTYTGQIVFTGPNSMSMTVPVTFYVSETNTPFFGTLPGEISFSLPVGGAPPGQTILVPAAGLGTLNWTVTTSTADGGDWLNVSSDAGTAPTDLTVSIAPGQLPGASFETGTFVGQLLFESDGGGAVTIPVNVIVGSSTFSQINPIYLTTTLGATVALPQNLIVGNTGADFDATAEAYTPAGGPTWLLSSSSGEGCCATPKAVTISVEPSLTLPAGTYTAELFFTNYDSGTMSMTVPVVLTVAAPGAASFENLPGQMSFFMQAGKTPASQAIEVLNAGSGTLNWTVTASTSDGGDWLSASPPSGTAPTTASVQIFPETLPGQGVTPGTFTGQLLFQTNGDSVTVPVNVVVGASVFNQVNPINFIMPSGGTNGQADPLPQVLTIASTDSNFNFNAPSVSTEDGGSWLQVTPAGPCCRTPEAFTVVVSAATLPAGTYTGQVLFSTGTASMTVPVTLAILPSGAASFSGLPGELSFSMLPGSAPPAQTFQLGNAGAGTLNWTVYGSTADGGSWLNVSPLSGTAPSTVTVSIIPNSLPQLGVADGTFTGQLVFQEAGDTVTVPVNVLVGSGIFNQLNPVAFTMLYGAGNPLPQTLTVASNSITNFNVNAFPYTSSGTNWLEISPAGNLCCGTPRVLTVSVNAASLLPGTYSGEIFLTNSDAGTIAMTIPVTLTVADPNAAFFDDITGQVSFNFAPTSTNPPTQTLSIRNAGFGALSWTATPTTSDGGAWLTVAPSGIAPSMVTVGVDVTNLPGMGVAGYYTGQILFQSAGSSVTVPVGVVIQPDVFGPPMPMPPLTFSVGNPQSQTLSVSATGSNFSFSAAAASGRGGNWLSISGSGSTPKSITVNVDLAGLSAGTYTGDITLIDSSNNMAMTVPVILTGNALATTTTLTSSPASVIFGQPVTLTATVTPAAATGNVTFADGSTILKTVTLTGGAATYTSTFPLGTNSLSATYSGSTTYAPSTGSYTLNVTTCALVSPTSISVDSTGTSSGPIQLTITDPTGCTWTASADSPWIGVSPSLVTGSGTVTVTIGPYVGGTADQSGNIIISVAGQGSSDVPVTQAFTAQAFGDVPPSDYYFDAVNLLSAKNITTGCSAATPPALPDYCPTELVNREEMAVFLVRSIYGGDIFPYSTTPIFSDVPASSPYFSYIQALYALGITSGCGSDGTDPPPVYCPIAPVTRAEMAIFIIRMRYGSIAESSPVTFNYPATAYFSDVPGTAYYFDWVQRMKLDNITSGCSATDYCPNNNVIRGDMAIFLMRAAFNELLPPAEPILVSISPTTIVAGAAPATYTITGLNTNFLNGVTILNPIPNITMGPVTVVNATTLTVQLSASSTAALQPVSPLAITGNFPDDEEAVLPNGLTVLAAP
jgi:hypothetical protein